MDEVASLKFRLIPMVIIFTLCKVKFSATFHSHIKLFSSYAAFVFKLIHLKVHVKCLLLES